MRILTLENECYNLQNLPKEITEDIRYSVLDNSDPKEPDYFFVPLIYLESFSSPAVVSSMIGNLFAIVNPYACDSDQLILPLMLNGLLLLTVDGSSLSFATTVSTSGPSGNLPLPPSILLPIASKFSKC